MTPIQPTKFPKITYCETRFADGYPTFPGCGPVRIWQPRKRRRVKKSEIESYQRDSDSAPVSLTP